MKGQGLPTVSLNKAIDVSLRRTMKRLKPELDAWRARVAKARMIETRKKQ